MSDERLQNFLRRYLQTGTPQDAVSFTQEYLRQHGVIPRDEIEDMEVAQYWLGNLQLDADNNLTHNQLFEWLDRNASFSHRDISIYEQIIHLGALYHIPDATPELFRWRLEGHLDDPTPPLLVPIIAEAYRRGFAYISFAVD